MQGYAWLYLIAYPIDYIIYAYNYIYGFSLFADALADLGVLDQARGHRRGRGARRHAVRLGQPEHGPRVPAGDVWHPDYPGHSILEPDRGDGI